MKVGDFSLFADDQEETDLAARVAAFNDNRTGYPRDKTTHRVFAEQAARTPDAVAAIGGNESLTYRELEEQSNRLARFLISRALPPESLVGVMLDRSPDMAVCLLGVMKAGAAYLPLNHDLPFERVKYMLDNAGVSVLVSSKHHMRTLNKLQWECANLDTLLCVDSLDVHAEPEEQGQMMREDMWDYILHDTFDDISGGWWRSSFTGEWLSREVMDGYGENIRLKLAPHVDENSRILEIGCASGISMFRLAPMAAFYCGTELSAEILRWTAQEMRSRQLDNIRLVHMPAHEIDRLDESDFDVVVINSVIQCFSGHNYLRDVLRKAIDLMADKGIMFLGNLWDQDLKAKCVADLSAFAEEHAGEGYTTKSDRSEELFIARSFLADLRHDFSEIVGIDYSQMLGTAESELSDYGYDAIMQIDKKGEGQHRPCASRSKYQFDRRVLAEYTVDSPAERSSGSGLAYVIYTSGTTGEPKGVAVEHRAILRLVLNTDYIELTELDRILQTGSLAFDASTFEIWGALLNGGAICFPQEEDLIDAAEIGHLIQKHEITVIFLTTSLFNMLAETDIEIFRGLKTLLTGGEKASVKHFNKVRQAHPELTLLHVYGPTENTTFTTSFPVERVFETDVPIGRPIANTTVHILDNGLKPVPIGVAGELCAGGDGLARGYLNDQSLTEKKFVVGSGGERLYRTGDLSRWLPDGNIEFLGRVDNQVKVRGYRIELDEIETRILQYTTAKQAAVLARDLGGESLELLAYIAADEPIDIDRLRKHLKHNLPDYMIPAQFIQLDMLPLNPSGKVDRKSLPAPESTRSAAGNEYAPPVTATEKRLASIWEKVLGRQGIGVTDNFFDSGGHSLKVTKLVSLIRGEMAVDVPLAVIFRTPTIRELARHIVDAAQFGAEEADEAVVLLNGNRGGRNIFAFPPGTGDVLSYIQLADLFGSHSLHAFNFLMAETRLNDYADYVAGIDPTGPYVFLGYSSGGNLAYHVAWELAKRGKRVSDIIMLDSGRSLDKIQFPAGEVERVIELFFSHDSIKPYLANAVLREKLVHQVRSYYAYMENTVDDHVIDADIHVLIAEDSSDISCDASGRPVVSIPAWAEVTRGKFKTYKAAGEHNYMLYQPALARNAELLLGIVDRANEEGGEETSS